MKTVDNFKLIRDYIEANPCDEDHFYFVQVLVRGKDGHKGEAGINGNNKNRMIKHYTIQNPEELDKFEYEMKGIAELVNGRVYIHPARRSFNQVATEMLLEYATMMKTGSLRQLKSAFSTAAGKSHDERIYIVDIDDVDFNDKEEVCKYVNLILECSEDKTLDRLRAIVPTVHGFHILVKPFNVKKYAEAIGKSIDECVKKNNPTLLYYKSLD